MRTEEDKQEVFRIEISDIDKRKELLKKFHKCCWFGAHLGTLRLLQRLKDNDVQSFNLCSSSRAGMSQDVHRFVRDCPSCKARFCPRIKTGDGRTYTPKRPFEIVEMDILGPLPVAYNEAKCILNFFEVLTKYVIDVGIADIKSENIAHNEEIWGTRRPSLEYNLKIPKRIKSYQLFDFYIWINSCI